MFSRSRASSSLPSISLGHMSHDKARYPSDAMGEAYNGPQPPPCTPAAYPDPIQAVPLGSSISESDLHNLNEKLVSHVRASFALSPRHGFSRRLQVSTRADNNGSPNQSRQSHSPRR
ncbi:hypothetical protein GGG16DRAFT_86008 [Schizophyllum commune]